MNERDLAKLGNFTKRKKRRTKEREKMGQTRLFRKTNEASNKKKVGPNQALSPNERSIERERGRAKLGAFA